MQFLQLNHYKIASYDAIILLQNRLRFRLIRNELLIIERKYQHVLFKIK